MLSFQLKALSQLSQVSTSQATSQAPSTPGPSTQASTRNNSLSPTPATRRSSKQQLLETIEARKRVTFEVDFALVGREHSFKKRTTRSIKSSRISWIYLHGMALEKDGKDKHWICKACYENGTAKVLVATSTTSCIKHLATHGFYPPGTQPLNSGADGTVDAWVEGVHPLQAERWRESFIDWITHDDITFEQGASPRLRRVIISGGPSVQHLLPSARTVRAWLISTYNERLQDVKKYLANSRSKINLSFDGWRIGSHCSELLVTGSIKTPSSRRAY